MYGPGLVPAIRKGKLNPTTFRTKGFCTTLTDNSIIFNAVTAEVGGTNITLLYFSLWDHDVVLMSFSTTTHVRVAVVVHLHQFAGATELSTKMENKSSKSNKIES